MGPARLPDFKDYKDLVYTQALLLETSRWLPVTPLVFPHRVTTDDNYRGFRISKGTAILAVCLLLLLHLISADNDIIMQNIW